MPDKYQRLQMIAYLQGLHVKCMICGKDTDNDTEENLSLSKRYSDRPWRKSNLGLKHKICGAVGSESPVNDNEARELLKIEVIAKDANAICYKCRKSYVNTDNLIDDINTLDIVSDRGKLYVIHIECPA